MTDRVSQRVGAYRLVEKLGEGGMGVVYRAHDERLGRDVAIKLLKPELATEQDRLRRFTDEARAMAAVSHPNIVAIHDVGTWCGRPFLVTELLQGETLKDRIRSGGITVATAVAHAIQVARGLEGAHECGFVHRDLKSENVFLTRDGQVKLLDFGIATLTAFDPLSSGDASGEDAAREDTQPGDLTGTPSCMSPEQIRGLPVDQRTDIFAVGVLLFEMFSRHRPFAGGTPAETMAMVLHDDPPPLPRRVPAALGQIVSRCLEKRPKDRFSSAHDLRLALEAFRRRGLTARGVRALPHVPAAAQILGSRPWRRAMFFAAIAVLAAATILGFRLSESGWAKGGGRADLIPHRIAVLPFENVARREQLESVGRLAAIRLSNSLATLGEVEVVRADEASAYPLDSLTRARSIGEATRAGLVLDGTVVRNGDQLEFTASLQDAGSGRIVRAFEPLLASRERPAEALDVLGGRVLIAVQHHLHPGLGFGSGDRWPHLDAYREYRRSLDLSASAPLEVALEHVERAIELDPEFAQVRLIWSGGITLSRPEVVKLELWQSHLPRLLSLDRTGLSASQLQILDGILMRVNGNWLGACKVFQSIYERDTRNCVSRMYVIDSAVRANRPHQAIDAFEGFEWDPVLPPQGKEVAIAAAAKAYHILGRHDEEIDALDRLGSGPLQENVRLWQTKQELAALAAAGRIDELDLRIEDVLVLPEVAPYQRARVIVSTAFELREHGHRRAATRLAGRVLEVIHESKPQERRHVGFADCCFDAMYLVGHAEEARALAYESTRDWSDSLERARVIGIAAARAGHESAAREQMLALVQLDRPLRYGQGDYLRARIAALIGQREEALHLLRRAIVNGFWDYTELRSCPDLESLRDHAEYQRLIEPKG